MKFKLDKDTVTPKLQQLMQRAKRPRAILGAGAKAVQVGIVRHLAELQRRGNEKGWPERKFFSGGLDSVKKRVGVATLTDSAAVVVIADPRFVHRIEGGTVTAKRARLLAIPLTALAYGLGGKGTLREAALGGLVMVRTKRGLYLALPTDNRGKGKDQLRFLFKLVPRATQKAHPDEMPDVKRLGASAREAMLKVAEKQVLGP